MLSYPRCAAPLALALLLAACQKRTGPHAGGQAVTPAVVAANLNDNAIPETSQPFLEAARNSPIHWQAWDPKVLGDALQARRLVFAMVGSAQYPGCTEAMEAIDRDPYLIKRINEEFVPVLVDVDSCREAGMLTGLLCPEIKLPISFPFMLFLSPEGNEVTWRPVQYQPGMDLRGLFDKSADLVSRMWAESPDYVMKNSRLDHENRQKKVLRMEPPATEDQRTAYLRETTRQLVSLYDEDVGVLSGTGGLFPTGIIQCLASAGNNPDTPPDLAARCRVAVKNFSEILLRSPMVDALDGGIYSARRSLTWDLPLPYRACMTQGRAIRALASLHSATGDPLALEVAIGAARFSEREFATPDGLFSFQRLVGKQTPKDILWSQEQLEQVLSPEEAKLWKTVYSTTALGNLPSESDPKREFFRMNSLGVRVPWAEAATQQGLSAEQAAALRESARKKLLKARQERVPERKPCPLASAAPSFRMVSAYAALYTATGDAAWRTKALDLANRCRSHFSEGALLVESRSATPSPICDARAFTYALAIQAALDLAEITLDERWRLWAGDLATTVAERFVDPEGRLVEAFAESTPTKLRLEDRAMLFDDSTYGVMRMNLARLAALGQPPPPAISPLVSSIPSQTLSPVIYTDSILATSFARSRVILELPANASDEWKLAASRLPLDRIARLMGEGPKARLRLPDGGSRELNSPAELTSLGVPADK